MPVLQFTYDSLPKVDDRGRRSLNEYVSMLATQIVNCYDQFQEKLQEAMILRSLLRNSLDLIGLDEHSDVVYDQKVTAKEGK